jgi:hypothetical protein
LLLRDRRSSSSFNLVVPNIPGPAVPMYMVGCGVRATYPVVLLADHHAVSVGGVVTINGLSCFGVYPIPSCCPT